MKNLNKKIFSLFCLGLIIIFSSTITPPVNNTMNTTEFNQNELNSSQGMSDYWQPMLDLSVYIDHSYNVYADATNDGYEDICLSNMNGDIQILAWNQSIEYWNEPINISLTLNGPMYGFFIADANNDGYNDIIISTSASQSRVYLSLWNNISLDWDPEFYLPVAQWSNRVFVEDIDNDGDNDIVTTSGSSDVLSIIKWNEVLSDWNPYYTKPITDPAAIYVDDVNLDGFNDMIVARPGWDLLVIMIWNDTLSDWNPTITKPVGTTSWGYPVKVISADVNGDGYVDIITANFQDDSASILLYNYATHNWDPAIIKPVGYAPNGLSINDVNNDGFNDIAITNNYDDTVSLLLWNNDSQDWDTETFGTLSGPQNIIIADYNHDSKNDLTFFEGNNYILSVFLWDLIIPFVNITNPSNGTIVGANAPYINLYLFEPNLKEITYQIEGQIQINTFSGTSGNLDQAAWDSVPLGDVVITFYAEDYAGNIGQDQLNLSKHDLEDPVVTISSPSASQQFVQTPTFTISISDVSPIISRWYTLDGGLTTYPFTGLTHIVNETVWNDLSTGSVTLEIYAEDSLGYIGSDSVIIIKSNPPVISGFNIFWLIGAISVTIVVLIRKKSIKL